MRKLAIVIILIILGLLSTGCAQKCLANTADDGKAPIASVTIYYKDNSGHEQSFIYTSEMAYPNPENPMGFYVRIPSHSDYSLLLGGEDGAGVSSMRLTSVVFAYDPDLTTLTPRYDILYNNYNDCALTNRYDTTKVSAHSGKFIYYELVVRDFSGTGAGVHFIVLPTE